MCGRPYDFICKMPDLSIREFVFTHYSMELHQNRTLFMKSFIGRCCSDNIFDEQANVSLKNRFEIYFALCRYILCTTILITFAELIMSVTHRMLKNMLKFSFHYEALFLHFLSRMEISYK